MTHKVTRPKRSTMGQLAARINAHLRRFEHDPAINVEVSCDASYTKPGKGLHSFYNAGACYPGGARLRVVYISYQGGANLTRDEAMRYLAKLDSGFVGRHFEALREK